MDRDPLPHEEVNPMKKLAIVMGLAYLASYGLLSWKGRYAQTPSGYIGPVHWLPAGLVTAESAAAGPDRNALGYFYYPLLLADRSLVHQPYPRC
jgi:hypothetical protein